MKIRQIVVALMVAISWPVGAVERAVNEVEVANPNLLVALQDIRKTLNADRTRLLFENGSHAESCLEYLNLLPKHLPLETLRNSEIRSEYLLCDSVRIISSEPFVANKKNPTHSISKVLFEKLDLRTFPSSLRNRTDDQNFTLEALFPGVGKFQGSKLEVETAEHFFKLEVVGVVHHGASSAQDWVVWVTDEIKVGNYKSYRTIVVPNVGKPSSRYVATLYP